MPKANFTNNKIINLVLIFQYLEKIVYALENKKYLKNII